MSSLLMGERFVAAYPKLIKALSGDVTAALVLQAINYRSNISKPDEFGEIWVDLRISEIADEIGISVPSTQRALQRLRDKSLIKEIQASGYNNKKLWAIDENGLNDLEENSEANQVRERIINNAPANNYKFESEELSISKEVNKNINKTRTFEQEVHDACNYLADRIEDNGSKRPEVTDKWLMDMQRIHKLDGRTWDEITAAIRWSQDDEFWRSNILSPGKLRKQYDRMRLQASRDQKKSKFSQALNWMQDINWNEQKELEQ